MIAVPAGFSVRVANGVAILSKGATELRYVERMQPIPAIEALWGDALPSTAPPRPFVTHEGEYAWILDGAAAGEKFAGRVLGAVVGDDFLAVLETTTTSASDHALQCSFVEDLLRGDVHMLGIRRRAYWHDAPDSWDAVLDDAFYVSYRPASGADAIIEVSPAMPRSLVERSALIAGLQLPPDHATAAVPSPLPGMRWSAVREDGRCFEAFIVEDSDYYYVAVGECEIGAMPLLVAQLEMILRSIQPIPRARSRMPARSSAGAFRRALIAGLSASCGGVP